MADSESKFKEKRTKKNKKRKERIIEETERRPKTHRISFSEQRSEPRIVEEEEAEMSGQRELEQNLEEGCPWRNLQLILSLQNKNLDIQKSVPFYIFYFFFLL